MCRSRLNLACKITLWAKFGPDWGGWVYKSPQSLKCCKKLRFSAVFRGFAPCLSPFHSFPPSSFPISSILLSFPSLPFSILIFSSLPLPSPHLFLPSPLFPYLPSPLSSILCPFPFFSFSSPFFPSPFPFCISSGGTGMLPILRRLGSLLRFSSIKPYNIFSPIRIFALNTRVCNIYVS